MNNNFSNNMQKSSKYKVVLCRHFETPKGCVYKDKCQFAHGANELSPYQGGGINQMPLQNFNFPQIQNQGDQGKKVPNPQNYKIVLCKNFEKEGICKYESFCTFAHGDSELRSKVDNSLLTQQIPFNPQFMYPQMTPQDFQLMNNFQMMPQQNIYDINQMYQFQNIPPEMMMNNPNDNNMPFPQNMSNLNNLNANNLNFYQPNIRNNNNIQS